MKLSTTFLALFAAVIAACTMMDQADARVGGDRDLGWHEKYTLYFANSCNTDVKVQINFDREQTIVADSCQVFQSGRQYEGPVTYTELGIDGATQIVSCETSHANLCNLDGMPENACVIKVDTCPNKKPPVRTPTPTKSPTRAPTRAPSPGRQCGRKCNNRYECGNKDGIVDKGFPYCGAACTYNRCQPFFQECNSDSDCDPNKTVCGEQGFCVGM
jgi:hypothetical protein